MNKIQRHVQPRYEAMLRNMMRVMDAPEMLENASLAKAVEKIDLDDVGCKLNPSSEI